MSSAAGNQPVSVHEGRQEELGLAMEEGRQEVLRMVMEPILPLEEREQSHLIGRRLQVTAVYRHTTPKWFVQEEICKDQSTSSVSEVEASKRDQEVKCLLHININL